MPRTVLVIDDEPDLVRLADYNLSQAGFLVLGAPDGETGLRMAKKHRPDLVVLDVMMPELDGWEVCKELRRDPDTRGLPILMLTSKAEETDRVLGLELGADDYVTKPFSVRELVARVKALLRRAQPPDEGQEVLKAGAIALDRARRRVTAGGKDVPLTTTEFDLLAALASRPGRVLSRDELIDRGLGRDAAVLDRTIDVHVAAIRRKLGKHGEALETVRGVGYRLKE